MAEVVDSVVLLTVALSWASDWDATVRSPPAVTAESVMYARACAGSSVPKLVPRSASSVANPTLPGSQPMALNAMEAPMEAALPSMVSEPLLELAVMPLRASIPDVSYALTRMLPVPVVDTSLSAIYAFTSPRMVFEV